MHLLVKIPTRSRPKQFLKTLESFVKHQSDKNKISYLISIDIDDDTMKDKEVLDRTIELIGPSGQIIVGPRSGKIGSVNRDMNYAP